MDKQAVRQRVQLMWPNQEEKEYLLGLLAADGVVDQASEQASEGSGAFQD